MSITAESRSSTIGTESLALPDADWSTIHSATGSRTLYQSLWSLNFWLLNRYRTERNTDVTTLSLTRRVREVDSDTSSAAFDLNGPMRTRDQAYASRITELGIYARDEGCHLNSESEVDFWRFIELVPRFRKGDLVLIDNGNLRAVWKDRQGSRLGLQFLGGGMLQYVIFRRRPTAPRISRVSGTDTFEGLQRQIDAFGLGDLLYE